MIVPEVGFTTNKMREVRSPSEQLITENLESNGKKKNILLKFVNVFERLEGSLV